MSKLRIDCFKDVRELPQDILNDFAALMVNRKGKNKDAYMLLRNISKAITPGVLYELKNSDLVKANKNIKQIELVKNNIKPKAHIEINAKWDKKEEFGLKSNILGGLGSLIVNSTQKDPIIVKIAETTSENLAYYGATLIKEGEGVIFEADKHLPLTEVSIGTNYIDGYIHVKEKGGVTFLEYHDRPHFHTPINDKAKGHLILGRKEGEKIILSAFQIPYGYGIHTCPYTIHTDAYLVGEYRVIFSVTKNYSTTILKNKNKALLHMYCR